MKVAVLMSTYNGEKYLNEQLASIAKQTIAESITVYIRDDGSNDGTLNIVRYWSERIKIQVFVEENIGVANSFWELLRKNIIADYYAFCDQDDVWDSNKLEIAISYLNENTHLYASNCRIIDEEGNVRKENLRDEKPIITIPTLFVSGCTQGCSMVFTKELKDYICTKEINCIPMHDIILMIYAYTYGKIYWDIIPRFGYRVHRNNVVAKENKSFFKKARTTYWNWNNSSRNSMADVASELYLNTSDMSEEEKKFVYLVMNYKKSFGIKIKLLKYKAIKKIDSKILRSYKIRVLMGLF